MLKNFDRCIETLLSQQPSLSIVANKAGDTPKALAEDKPALSAIFAKCTLCGEFLCSLAFCKLPSVVS